MTSTLLKMGFKCLGRNKSGFTVFRKITQGPGGTQKIFKTVRADKTRDIVWNISDNTLKGRNLHSTRVNFIDSGNQVKTFSSNLEKIKTKNGYSSTFEISSFSCENPKTGDICQKIKFDQNMRISSALCGKRDNLYCWNEIETSLKNNIPYRTYNGGNGHYLSDLDTNFVSRSIAEQKGWFG